MKWFSLLLLIPIVLIFWVAFDPPDSTYHPMDPDAEERWLREMGCTEQEIEDIQNTR